MIWLMEAKTGAIYCFSLLLTAIEFLCPSVWRVWSGNFFHGRIRRKYFLRYFFLSIFIRKQKLNSMIEIYCSEFSYSSDSVDTNCCDLARCQWNKFRSSRKFVSTLEILIKLIYILWCLYLKILNNLGKCIQGTMEILDDTKLYMNKNYQLYNCLVIA